MKQVLTLIRHDLNSTFRDPLFKGLLFFPFVCFALVRWVFPLLITEYPVLQEYQMVLVMWATLQSATMFGFIYGFLFLEEKEEQLLPVLRILPVSTSYLVFIRQTVAVLISTLVNFCILHYGGFTSASWWFDLLVSFQMGLLAPVITLALTVFAKTRVEGLAQMKIINLIFIAPGLIYFVPGTWMHLLALIPSYWSFRSIEYGVPGLTLLIGFAVCALVLALLNRYFRKHIFQ